MCVTLYCTSANLDWQRGAEVVAMKGGDRVCINVANEIYDNLWECQIYIQCR